MKKRLIVMGLVLVLVLVLAGCGNGEEAAPENGGEENGTVGENGGENGVGDGNGDGGEDVHEGGLYGHWPLYPGATFVEIEEDPSGQIWIEVFIYESDDSVEEIYNWYLSSIEAAPEFERAEVEYESDDFCKVEGIIYFEPWDNEISDMVQIDSRNRDNTQLRFIVSNLDKLPGQ